MRWLLWVALSFPIVAMAQQPAPMTGPQQVASFLASSLTEAMAENDRLRAQVADLTKQLADAKTAKEAPKP